MDNDRITGFRAVHPGEVLGEELKERGIKLQKKLFTILANSKKVCIFAFALSKKISIGKVNNIINNNRLRATA